MVDESWILPVIVKLGGSPSVTEEGDIVYVFPELMNTVDPRNESISLNN